MSEVKGKTFIEKLSDEFNNEFSKATYTKDEVVDIITKFSIRERELKNNQADVFTFGKYKFKTVKDVARFDKQYLIWLITTNSISLSQGNIDLGR